MDIYSCLYTNVLPQAKKIAKLNMKKRIYNPAHNEYTCLTLPYRRQAGLFFLKLKIFLFYCEIVIL